MEFKEAAHQPYRGLLGQTSGKTVIIRSDTGSAFAAQLYSSVNVTTNPELRDALLAQTLNQVACPWTDKTYDIAQSVVYHDEDLRLLALIIPESLRHQEFSLRQEFLEQLSQDAQQVIPRYVMEFDTVIGVSMLEQVIQRHIERSQLGEVAARIEKESSRMDEVVAEVAAERADLEALKLELEAQKREIEAQTEQLMTLTDSSRSSISEQSVENYENRETTMVVDDDAMLEEMMVHDAEPPAPSDESHTSDEEDNNIESGTVPPAANGDISESLLGDESAEQSIANQATIDSEQDDESASMATEDDIGNTGIQEQSRDTGPENILSDNKSYFIDIRADGMPIIGWRMASDDIDAWKAVSRPELKIQFRLEEDRPVVNVLIFDQEPGQSCASLWKSCPLNVESEQHEGFLKAMEQHLAANIRFYNQDGVIEQQFNLTYPYAENIAWCRQFARRTIRESGMLLTDFETVAGLMQKDSYNHFGEFRHNFEEDSFSDISTPSQAQLASSVVGFWSTHEKFCYLIGMQAFPLRHFRAIQTRVIKSAIEWGICLNPLLSDIAVELGFASHEADLAEILIANFAEVCVNIRFNDLDPLQQWDNWDALITLAQSLQITLRADILELAEASLKRAQDFQTNTDSSTSDEDVITLDGDALEMATKIAVDNDKKINEKKTIPGHDIAIESIAHDDTANEAKK